MNLIKHPLTLLFLFALQLTWGQKKEQLANHFLLAGQLLLVDPFEATEEKAGNTQVIVHQDGEIFVVFNSLETGKYEFYLPLGHVYSISYGGQQFVNKKVIVDSSKSPKEKKPRRMNLDIGLFLPIEGASFPTLEQPFVKIAYDQEYDDFVPDFDYTENMLKQLDKDLKLAKKSRNKSSKPTPPSTKSTTKDL
jgi:hypothetical protein